MEKYTRVRKGNAEAVPPAENEIRVMTNGPLRQYVGQALEALEEKGLATVVLKAMGRAINKAVSLAEIVRRRVAGLHQLTEISSVAIIDTWEPKEEGEGLAPLQATRNVSALTITLSRAPLDTSLPGYQPPLPADQVVAIGDAELEQMEHVDSSGRGPKGGRPSRGRGRGRRGRGRGRGAPPAEGGGEAPAGPGPEAGGDGLAELGAAEGGAGQQEGRGQGRGRGRARNRGGRGRGRRGGRGGQGGDGGAAGGGEGGDAPASAPAPAPDA